MKGKIVVHSYESSILKSNPLKDPYKRELIIYLPPGYSQSYSKGYVTVFVLPGFGSQGRVLLNADPLRENIEERMNRLVSGKKCGPMVLVLVDCFTRFGGNQYLNSSATGRYEDYIVKEIVSFVDKNYNTSSRAVFGHSSGGYGSIILGMRHPDVFYGLADHSGDAHLNIVTFQISQKLSTPLDNMVAVQKNGLIISGRNRITTRRRTDLL